MINGIHIYAGDYPDDLNGPYARDKNCPVCLALAIAEDLENMRSDLAALAKYAGASGTVHYRGEPDSNHIVNNGC